MCSGVVTEHTHYVCLQLQKLGIIPFDEHLGGAMLTTYKVMWANNGDCISRQYTGTAAMKVTHWEGDTRYYFSLFLTGRPDQVWGEEVQWNDEGRLQLCSSVSLQMLTQTKPTP